MKHYVWGNITVLICMKQYDCFMSIKSITQIHAKLVPTAAKKPHLEEGTNFC